MTTVIENTPNISHPLYRSQIFSVSRLAIVERFHCIMTKSISYVRSFTDAPQLL